jgi:hypothetical protein
MSKPNIKVVESYFSAIKAKDLSRAPLAKDVTFEDPFTPKLSGREAVLAFLSNFLQGIKDLRIRQHIADGEYVATLWDADTTAGVIPIFECFRVIGGEIKEAKAFLDPRPITNPTQ